MTSTDVNSELGSGLAARVLQRVVFPPADQLDVVPLYVETELERGAEIKDAAGFNPARPITRNASVASAHAAIRFGADVDPIVTDGVTGDPRRSAVITAGQRVSFATYFNAFPASYWRRWTTVKQVTLRIRVTGAATIVVYRSSAKGLSHPIETISLMAGATEIVETDLGLEQFVDGGWYWFDVVAGDEDVLLHEADWRCRSEAKASGRLSIGITTFNRPESVVDLLRSIGESGTVVDLLDAVYLVDQGTDRAEQQANFDESVKRLAGLLNVIDQPNLGGSGGFSRAMLETLTAGRSDYVLLLDDDVVLEPEGVLRALTFADLARRPTIVGGHMFSMHDRSVLHAFGETVSPYRWWWGADSHTTAEHDFGRQGLRHTNWLHRRVDVDYNGWWMCLLPTSIVAEIGLALPVFIKWDDAEYGLRAHKAGYSTVSMPGVAVWHVPWHDKNDAVDWQAYYHARNRLLAALLHSPYPRGGRVVAESMEIQIQHLLSMQYSTVELRLRALEDLLAGPGHLHPDLPTKLGELRDVRREFTDARIESDVEAFPPVRRRKPPSRGREATSPSNKLSLMVKAGLGALRQLAPIAVGANVRPTAAVPHQDAPWWFLANHDSVLVSAADGAGAAWYQRDPELFRRQLARSIALHSRLFREWPDLARSYRSAAADVTSSMRWAQTFDPPE